MADFLTRLVERAWGQVPTVQPLIPSRYAATPARVESPPLDSLAPAEPSEPLPGTPRLAAIVPNPPADVETNIETKPTWPSLEPGGEDSPHPRTVPPVPAPVSAPNAPLSRPQPPRVESEPKIDHPRRLESPLTLAVSLTQVAPEPTRRTAIPQPAPDSGSDQTIRDSTPATATRPLFAPPDPLPATIFPTRTAPSSTVGPSLANGFSRPASEPPAPSINVTIGRVEVRAIFEPPAKAAPPTKPEPKLSLEDYLRASTGGRR